jgi:hypothetical protein
MMVTAARLTAVGFPSTAAGSGRPLGQRTEDEGWGDAVTGVGVGEAAVAGGVARVPVPEHAVLSKAAAPVSIAQVMRRLRGARTGSSITCGLLGE